MARWGPALFSWLAVDAIADRARTPARLCLVQRPARKWLWRRYAGLQLAISKGDNDSAAI